MRESIWPPEYDPGADYVVNKPLRFAGVDYEVGEPFDVHTSERQMRILYGSRFIRLAEPSITKKSPPPVLPPTPASVADDAPGPVDDGAADSGALDVKKPPELVKKSGGWYDVIDSEGNKLNEKSLRIKDAERLIKEASHDLDVQQ